MPVGGRLYAKLKMMTASVEKKVMRLCSKTQYVGGISCTSAEKQRGRRQKQKKREAHLGASLFFCYFLISPLAAAVR